MDNEYLETYFEDYAQEISRLNGWTYADSMPWRENKKKIMQTYDYQKYCFCRALDDFKLSLCEEFSPIINYFTNMINRITRK